MREQRALRPSGRAGGVDEQQPVVVRDGARRSVVALQQQVLERRDALVQSGASRRAPPEASSTAGSASVELVRELRRRQPPVQRQQDQPGLRAGEEDDDVLGARPGQRRDAVAAREPGGEQAGGEPLRALVELAVGRLAAEEVDRDAARRRPRAVADPAVEGQRPLTAGTPRRRGRTAQAPARRRGGRSRRRPRAARPGSARRAARALRGSTTDVAVARAGRASAPRSRRAGRRRRTQRRPPPAPPRPQASAPFASRCSRIRSTSSGRGSGSSAFTTNVAERSPVALRQQPHRLLRHRVAPRPAGRRAGEHEPVDALGLRQRELLRDHPAEARAEHVRALDAGLVEHLHRILGQLRSRVRPRRRVALADRRGCRTRMHVERARERLDDRLPAPARVAEPVDQQQRRARSPCRSQAIFTRAPSQPRALDAGARAAGARAAEARQPARDEEDEQDEEACRG